MLQIHNSYCAPNLSERFLPTMQNFWSDIRLPVLNARILLNFLPALLDLVIALSADGVE